MVLILIGMYGSVLNVIVPFHLLSLYFKLTHGMYLTMVVKYSDLKNNKVILFFYCLKVVFDQQGIKLPLRISTPKLTEYIQKSHILNIF